MTINYELLSTIKYPLAAKFYQQQGINSKTSSHNIIAVARNNHDIVGIAQLTPIKDFWLLTGVLVDKKFRQQGIAINLITALNNQQVQVFTFAYKHLLSFYERLGFKTLQICELPLELSQRFEAYSRQGRDIIAMKKS